MPIKPGKAVPNLDLPTIDAQRFRLSERHAKNFILLVVYRGYHCPICKTYLRDLDQRVAEFSQRGVDVVAVSTDDQERAKKAKSEWELTSLPLGYGLSIDQAREWGLYISASIKPSEPPLFAEPGLFLIRSDGTLYAASIQTMPFARPSFSEVLAAIDFISKVNYPARGEA